MSDVIIRDKAEYHARTSEQMERHLAVPPWSLRQKIALTCRILANEGHESALAGQITARGDRPGTYWMLSLVSASTRHAPAISCWSTTISNCSPATAWSTRRIASIYGSTVIGPT